MKIFRRLILLGDAYVTYPSIIGLVAADDDVGSGDGRPGERWDGRMPIGCWAPRRSIHCGRRGTRLRAVAEAVGVNCGEYSDGGGDARGA
jgi:hypothetical protein